MWFNEIPLKEDADSRLFFLSWENLDLAEETRPGLCCSLGRMERGELESMNSSGIWSWFTLHLDLLTRLKGDVDLRVLGGTSRLTGTGRGRDWAGKENLLSYPGLNGRDCVVKTRLLAPPSCMIRRDESHQLNWAESGLRTHAQRK